MVIIVVYYWFSGQINEGEVPLSDMTFVLPFEAAAVIFKAMLGILAQNHEVNVIWTMTTPHVHQTLPPDLFLQAH